MLRARFVAGLLMIVAAVVTIVFADDSFPLPVAIGMCVVGIALAVSSRKRRNSHA